jgi:hypothetical protein
LNVSSPASSNSRRRSRAHGGTAWRFSSARLWARCALPWIRRASSESIVPTRGRLFAETTRTHRRMDLWSLGDTRIRAFCNSPSSGDVGVNMPREASLSRSIFFRSRQLRRVCCAFVVGAQYVEWIAVGARLDLQVTR